jgi:hypothetical protein
MQNGINETIHNLKDTENKKLNPPNYCPQSDSNKFHPPPLRRMNASIDLGRPTKNLVTKIIYKYPNPS